LQERIFLLLRSSIPFFLFLTRFSLPVGFFSFFFVPLRDVPAGFSRIFSLSPRYSLQFRRSLFAYHGRDPLFLVFFSLSLWVLLEIGFLYYGYPSMPAFR